MADKTMLTCGVLLIISVILFVSTGLIIMSSEDRTAPLYQITSPQGEEFTATSSLELPDWDAQKQTGSEINADQRPSQGVPKGCSGSEQGSNSPHGSPRHFCPSASMKQEERSRGYHQDLEPMAEGYIAISRADLPLDERRDQNVPDMGPEEFSSSLGPSSVQDNMEIRSPPCMQGRHHPCPCGSMMQKGGYQDNGPDLPPGPMGRGGPDSYMQSPAFSEGQAMNRFQGEDPGYGYPNPSPDEAELSEADIAEEQTLQDDTQGEGCRSSRSAHPPCQQGS